MRKSLEFAEIRRRLQDTEVELAKLRQSVPKSPPEPLVLRSRERWLVLEVPPEVDLSSRPRVPEFMLTTELVPRTRRDTSSKSWFRCQRGAQQIVAAVAETERKLQAASGFGANVSVNSAPGVIARNLSNKLKDLAAVAKTEQDVLLVFDWSDDERLGVQIGWYC